jgi:predicted DNA-binding protein (MmcQ/YjbR family)
MKQLFKTILTIIISYALMSFITWDWNITTWEYYQRLCMVIIALVTWLLITLVETADRSLNDESTRNDEILDSYYKDKRYWINKK